MLGIGGHAHSTPDRAALVAFGNRLTFGEFDARQRALAGLLADAGLGRGDRIAVLAANRVEYLEVTTGALRAGRVPVPIHAALTGPEISYILEDSGARWLFTDRPLDRHPSVERAITFGDAYERCLHEASPADIADYTLTRPMHYTSGTTGAPKGVWVAPHAEDRARGLATNFGELWGLTPEDIHLVCSPLSHSAPHRFALRTLEAGGTVFVQSRFKAEETLAAIELVSATTAFMVPTHLERIFALDEQLRGRHDVRSMRLLAHAGAPIREETKRRAIDFFPDDSVWEFYGSTEGQATRISPTEWMQKPGSVGRPLPGSRIVIAPVEEGEAERGPGQVWVDDPAGERFEYWGDPLKTRAAWRGDAFSVGDLGILDDDGYLFLTGRMTDTIISGGVNVFPQEVELVLRDHPGVQEALVYGVDDAEWGQQVRAQVVARGGEVVDRDELGSWLRERLASYKCPRLIDIVSELPRTPTGKLKREPPQ